MRVINYGPNAFHVATCPKCQSVIEFLPNEVEPIKFVDYDNKMKIHILALYLTCCVCGEKFDIKDDFKGEKSNDQN